MEQFMHVSTTFLACALAACGAAHAASAPEHIDPWRLTEGKVTLAETTSTGMAGKSFAAGTLIAAPVQELCTLLQDYERYPAFMPNTQSTRISQKGTGFSVIDVTLALPMGKIKKYRLRMEPRSSAQSCRLAWKLVPWPGLAQEETIVDTTGYWELTPSSASGKTAVKYVVHTDAGPIPFGLGWIVDSLSKDSIPQTLEALRKRAAAK
jgi:hypothetical protein